MIALELAAVIPAILTICRQCQSLAAFAVRVHQVDVVQLEVLGPDTQSRGQIVVRHKFLAAVLGDGDFIGRVRSRVLGVSEDGDGAVGFWDVDLLVVGAWCDEDALSLSGIRESIYCCLDCGVFLLCADL